MREMLMEALKKGLKDGKILNKGSKEEKAKADVLKSITDLLGEMDLGKLSEVKKVVIAAPTTEGLIKGLDMAKEKVEDIGEEKEEGESESECSCGECDMCKPMDKKMSDLAKLKALAIKK